MKRTLFALGCALALSLTIGVGGLVAADGTPSSEIEQSADDDQGLTVETTASERTAGVLDPDSSEIDVETIEPLELTAQPVAAVSDSASVSDGVAIDVDDSNATTTRFEAAELNAQPIDQDATQVTGFPGETVISPLENASEDGSDLEGERLD